MKPGQNYLPSQKGEKKPIPWDVTWAFSLDSHLLASPVKRTTHPAAQDVRPGKKCAREKQEPFLNSLSEDKTPTICRLALGEALL